MFSILIVDDDVLALDGLKNGLHFQAMGFDQAFFASGMRSACDILTRQPIDVLVADIEMPAAPASTCKNGCWKGDCGRSRCFSPATPASITPSTPSA